MTKEQHSMVRLILTIIILTLIMVGILMLVFPKLQPIEAPGIEELMAKTATTTPEITLKELADRTAYLLEKTNLSATSSEFRFIFTDHHQRILQNSMDVENCNNKIDIIDAYIRENMPEVE